MIPKSSNKWLERIGLRCHIKRGAYRVVYRTDMDVRNNNRDRSSMGVLVEIDHNSAYILKRGGLTTLRCAKHNVIFDEKS